jgi:cytochrome P450
MAGCPVAHDFDPLAPEFLRDPFAILAGLDADAPVFYAPALDHYVVTRHADIDAVFHDNETFSAANARCS